jgi:hypothetical protein
MCCHFKSLLSLLKIFGLGEASSVLNFIKKPDSLENLLSSSLVSVCGRLCNVGGRRKLRLKLAYGDFKVSFSYGKVK